MSLRLGLIQINVTDLAEAWRFYVDTLGLQGFERLGRGKAFHLAAEGAPEILVYPVKRLAARQYPEDTGITLIFYTSDIDQTVADWRQKHVQFIPIAWSKDASGIAETPFGPFIAFRDPFGNVHELLQPT